MATETPFVIGAKASCLDGPCGEVRRVIIDPATDTVTHLVIGPGHRREAGRLVPLDLIETTAGEVRLRCTRAEFGQLDAAEEDDLVEGTGSDELPSGGLTYSGGEAYGPIGRAKLFTAGPQTVHPRVVIEDVVPRGEIEVSPGDRVHALDGEIGQVRGFLADPDGDRVTHVLLQDGHLWGRKDVAIPVSAVTGVEDGIRLSITREQVENLPPVDISHLG